LKELINTFTSTYSRRRITNNPLFKLGMGCLGLIFIAVCLGTLMLVYFLLQ
jgi:hypothetical protein